jgi:lincosamide nucleotidyltransferase A/C/D/E
LYPDFNGLCQPHWKRVISNRVSDSYNHTPGVPNAKREIERPFNFVLADKKGREIDVHVISRDQNGNGIYGPPEMGLMYPADSLNGSGIINDCPVRCISPEWTVKFHSGYTLTEKDYKDVSALCKKYGLALPQEYLQFKRSG